MSSPAPSNAGGNDKKPLEQITFRFCSECSNMLYPKEDEVDRKLLFTCRTCSYSEEATSSCIFRNVLNNAAGETAGVTQDVGSDPTVSTPIFPDNSVSPEEGPFSLVFCVSCGVPIVCSVCKTNTATLKGLEEQPGEDAVVWDITDEHVGVFTGGELDEELPLARLAAMMDTGSLTASSSARSPTGPKPPQKQEYLPPDTQAKWLGSATTLIK
ncbi:hypothetical protein OQA88_847 [Cercophora sp. LCS_1]